jgi:hypothetical protein
VLGKDCMTGSADLGREPCNRFIGVSAVAYLAALKRSPLSSGYSGRRFSLNVSTVLMLNANFSSPSGPASSLRKAFAWRSMS